MTEIRLIDANALKDEMSKVFFNDNDDMRRIEKLIDNAPTVDAIINTIEVRPQGEITDEDIQNAIKQGYNDGYEMAKAKFERPKGDIEFAKWVADQIFFKEVKDDLFVELACRKLEKLGLVEKTESEWILRGGGENE